MEKINVVELLKDCPQGMELDCTMYEDVHFDYIDELNIIHCYIQHETHKTSITFNQHGTPNSDIKSKCVIFPKGKTSWDGFVPPCKFKDGDVISNSLGTCIFKGEGWIKGTVDYYCGIHADYFRVKDHKQNPKGHYGNIADYRLATKEEKGKLFKAIKDNGYRWNAETKTLDKLIKPPFKVGYKIKHIKTGNIYEIIKIISNYYIAKYLGSDIMVSWNDHDEYVVVSNKFDINKLKPFDKVLTRANDDDSWVCNYYSHRIEGYYVILNAELAVQCIPYEGNEHLLGTANDCDDFYKNW